MSLGQCKRLIEVDLPIKTISEHARREKSIRHGHISTLHIWWARRPLAACRAVVLGALLPDPADPNCPEEFRKKAWELLNPLGTDSMGDNYALRQALLDFIGDFSAWEKSTDKEALNAARGLVRAAHPTRPPLVVDPFAGGGAIPLEALRVGADAFAVDYNPVATLLLRTVLEYIPRHGQKLANEVEKWGRWVKEHAQIELSQFYPNDKDGAQPLAYLWARTARCEGPGCGAEIPLLKYLWIVNRDKKRVAFRISVDKLVRRINVEIVNNVDDKEVGSGTVRRGAVTCPVCGYTTPVERIRAQANNCGLGSRMVGVVTYHPKSNERKYRAPNKADFDAAEAAEKELKNMIRENIDSLSLIPDEPLPPEGTLGPRVAGYGVKVWGDLFTNRQALAIATFCRILRETNPQDDISKAVTTCAALALSNSIHYQCNLSTYLSDGMVSVFIQGLGFPMRWDFAEANPLVEKLVGGFDYSLCQVINVIEENASLFSKEATVRQGSATSVPLPDASALALVTDPPYYDSIPYANASDLFYVWWLRAIRHIHPELFAERTTPKNDEIIVNMMKSKPLLSKDKTFYERKMKQALTECKRILTPDGIAVIVFAHKSTSGWEALLNAIVSAGWQITASWPIETERAARMRAYQTASLGSSVHLVCRPRPSNASVGDWRDVLSELQPRVHSWMQRLVKEGIVGADAIFACIGPALEIFSRYDRIETAGGKRVELKEYLEHVWATVAREALKMIFEGADPTGFEEDARLTALWLWTLRTGTNGMNGNNKVTDETDEEDEGVSGRKKVRGYVLEYDAVRKIAQGLGAHLEELDRPGGIVEIQGKAASLLFVKERRKVLFEEEGDTRQPKRKPGTQMTLLEGPVVEETVKGLPSTGKTILDKLHQAMLLFADGRSEALKRFLVEESISRDDRFWRLANALSALYPRNSEEKRWVDGVLSRKKALGF